MFVAQTAAMVLVDVDFRPCDETQLRIGFVCFRAQFEIFFEFVLAMTKSWCFIRVEVNCRSRGIQ